ncbi:MAG TPA: 50S ribosomal protein L5 [Candidatus Paceibacterota bacterium]|nr:50S ribosomal protein L5 [Candidatus Pacearchaeota archaeon]HPZ74995.1 50S ribosomal protein L5 [Candidatus Pacearchaeota archaeon]HQD89339.1 50S ribosomal protein L5 [Candidatus Pacearchaeota archaeon]HRR39435.1 50S ribosomal protein L5 [Candidatus Paceibacterota bacterium]
MMLSLKEKYNKEVIPLMVKKFGYKSIMAVPKIKKVAVNVGIGKILESVDPSKRENIIKDISSNLALICGQKPVVTKARKAIAGFKIREGSPVGIKVVLRKDRMYDFLERVINLALPRSRDFQGISQKSIDKKGNLTIGIKEHIVFPEVKPENSKVIFGMEVTVVVEAKKREEALELYKLLGFPLKV